MDGRRPLTQASGHALWLLVFSSPRLRQPREHVQGVGFLTGALLVMWLFLLNRLLGPLFSPYLAVWIRGIKSSQQGPRPGALLFTDNEALGVKGWWVVGVCHLHTHSGACCCLPWWLKFSSLAEEEPLLILHGNDEASRWASLIIQRLEPQREDIISTCCSSGQRKPSAKSSLRTQSLWLLHFIYYLRCL